MIIVKIDSKGVEHNYGGGFKNINDAIPKSYKFNGFFYENPKTKSIYIVKKEKRDAEV